MVRAKEDRSPVMAISCKAVSEVPRNQAKVGRARKGEWMPTISVMR